MSRVRAGGGRQLSGKEGGSEDDPEIAAIVELCLELEQEYARSLQPSEMPQQMHWGDSQPWQHVSGSREELHTGAQSTSLLAWDGSVPSSSVGTPGFHQGPAVQTDNTFSTRPADMWEAHGFQGAGPSTSAGVSTMLLPSADGSLPHQGPGTQTAYSFLRGSADMWGSPESLGEPASTSAGVSTMRLPSADGSVPTASAGYGSLALPAADSAASSFQGFHVPSSSAPLNAPLVFGEFNPGLVLPQAQPWVPPGAPVHDVQPSIQRSPFPSIVEALSVGKRRREDYPATYPVNPPKKYMSPSGKHVPCRF
ncbi:uncharacterized protein EMH_0047120 [Eimeria mitis]|uniref:Uncharacterized protein n=1 Tax=Eimeria mitis TaxID=44415 RepID=U6K034_9EIME|nr:uncharacterized protein EMH_0047120 [Eimeria mitis]CDJ29123.1 hypothetical protein EMH_0047120 [Eimeria mitis]